MASDDQTAEVQSQYLTPANLLKLAQDAIRAGADPFPTREPCTMCHRLPMPLALRDKATRQAYQDLRLEVINAFSRGQPQTLLHTPGFDRGAMTLEHVVREMMVLDQHDLLHRLLWIAGKAMASENPMLRTEALSLADTIAHHHGIYHREELTDQRTGDAA